MEYRIIIGVQPGYHVDNVSPVKAAKMAFTAKSAYSEFKDSNITPIIVVYPEEYGAPKGGENGVLISGKTSEISKIIIAAGKLMADLGQIDASVLSFSSGKFLSSSSIHNEFEKDKALNSLSLISREVFVSDKSAQIYFDIPIDDEDMFTVAEKLQKAQSTLDKDEDYIVVGTVFAVGNEVHFSCAPNAKDKQNDKEKFSRSVKKLIENAGYSVNF